MRPSSSQNDRSPQVSPSMAKIPDKFESRRGSSKRWRILHRSDGQIWVRIRAKMIGHSALGILYSLEGAALPMIMIF